MEFPHIVAQIMAIAYLSVAVASLTGSMDFKKMYKEFMASAALMYISGIMALILGYIIVYNHNVWEKNWTVLITIVGWLALTKGVMLIACPSFLKHFEFMVDKKAKCIPIITIVFGCIFAYYGFMT